MNTTHYDYIIAGGGGAGLSLVHHLLQTRLSQRSVLIIDRDEKEANDRTWCFWEAGAGPFEAIVHHRWQHVYFHGEGYSKLLNLLPYHYKMIRSGDFYQHVRSCVTAYPNITWLKAEVQSVHETAAGARVETSEGSYTADWVFNSLRDPHERLNIDQHIYLLQHFKGWVIQTPEDFFDPERATLMDFRIDQHGECRFFYVLPTDKRTALVEFTLFSLELLPDRGYEEALRQYLQQFLSLDDYAIKHEEFGVIPMTNQPYPSQRSEHVINLGTAGGMTKPSTGYTFQRMQQDSEQLLGSLLRTGRPERHSATWNKRFNLYDNTLLQVMNQNQYPVKEIFTDIFRKNPPERVLRFLSEETTFQEEIRVANSVKKRAFIRGMGRALFS